MIRKILCEINTNESLSLDKVNLSIAQFYSKIDKAVKKGILPKNYAARKKSMLAQKLKDIAKSL